jgi:hypothetical protein
MTELPNASSSAFTVFEYKHNPWVTFLPCGVAVNLDTGEVKIPEGLTMSEASLAIWNGMKRWGRPEP